MKIRNEWSEGTSLFFNHERNLGVVKGWAVERNTGGGEGDQDPVQLQRGRRDYNG